MAVDAFLLPCFAPIRGTSLIFGVLLVHTWVSTTIPFFESRLILGVKRGSELLISQNSDILQECCYISGTKAARVNPKTALETSDNSTLG